MPRVATGSIETIQCADNTTTVRGRFRHEGQRYRVVFGQDVDGWTEARARSELEAIHALLKAGIALEKVLARYETDIEPERTNLYTAGISTDEYASDWLERRKIGEIGEAPLADNTYDDYRWRLKSHILPFFGKKPVVRVTTRDFQRFRGKLFQERAALLEIVEVGVIFKDKRGRSRKPLSLRSIQMQLRLAKQIFAQAVKDEIRSDNPGDDPDLKVSVPKPTRTFLELDQLAVFLDAAHTFRPRPARTTSQADEGASDDIRARLSRRDTQYALRLEYGLSSGRCRCSRRARPTLRGTIGSAGALSA